MPALEALGRIPVYMLDNGVHVPINSSHRAILTAAHDGTMKVGWAAAHAAEEHHRAATHFSDKYLAEDDLAVSLTVGLTPLLAMPPPEPPDFLPDSKFDDTPALPQPMAEVVVQRVLASSTAVSIR
jgi:hypothetical protein